MESLQPKKRSPLRLKLGKIYYTTQRYRWWMRHGKELAHVQQTETLDYQVFEHRTPLLRRLKDVEMVLQYNKVQNLKLAAKKLNHIIIRPGETFSYWRLIGKPTKAKGYLDGMILFSGTFTAGVGGGLCQMSNLIYWMTIHTPLTITERYRHSFDVFPDTNRTQPFGSGATCVYNYRDLMIKNETPYTYQLEIEITDTHLVGRWLCNYESQYTYEVYEKEHAMRHEVWGGYTRHNILWRKRKDRLTGDVCEEFVTENHAIMMYQPFIEAKA